MPNEQMGAYWSDVAGPEWVQQETTFDQMLEPFGRTVLDALDLRAGETVLDIGCGFGTTAVQAARLVGAAGRVVGIDISPAMIDRAEQRARGIDNVSFVVADAQEHGLDDPVDALVSRFGVMFFDDPVAAFANLRRSVRAGGRLAFVCWQSIDANPWVTASARAWAPFLAATVPPAPPDAPGPFAFAAAERVTGILSSAGWTGIDVEPLHTEALMGAGRGVDGAVDQVLATTVARTLRGQLSPEQFEAAIDALRDELAGHLVDGAVVYPAAAWVVRAHR